MDSLLEVKSGLLHTFDGEAHEVHGGAYLTPEAYLSTHAELTRLRERQAEHHTNIVPALVIGVGLASFALGYWLGRPDDDE